MRPGFGPLPDDDPVAAAPIVFAMPGERRFARGLDPAVLGHVAFETFPNGEVHAGLATRVEGRPCIVIGSVSPPAVNMARLTLLAHTLRRGGATHIGAVIPYLAYARQDRAPRQESLGLAWVGELLAAGGVDEVVCVDVHSEQAGDVLGLPLTSLAPARLLADALDPEWREDVTFVAPDEGAIPRCAALAEAAGSSEPIVWMRKRRAGARLEHLATVGAPRRRAIVVDDILDTGGTLMSCVDRLGDAGVEAIALVVTHGLFTGARWRELLRNGVKAIWITDTVLVRQRPMDVHVVSVAPLLAAVLTPAAREARC